MKTSADTRTIGTILKGVREKSLIPKAHFQRRAVWTSRDKIELIRTIMDGYPFPEIYIAAGAVNTESGETTELLVDGQQRVRTIDEYFRGVKPFNSSRAIPAYAKLDETEKKRFLSYEVAIRNMGLIDDADIREAFRRMNSTSYDLNDMERFNAVYLGEFKKFCERVADKAFTGWPIFSSNDIRRMKDVSYVAALTATMMSTYFNRDEEIESYLETYNEEFPERDLIADRYLATIEFISELNLSAELRVWGKADFFNLFVEVDRQLYKLGRRPVSAAAGEALSKFYTAVARGRVSLPSDALVRQYFEATLQGVNDRGARIARGEAVRAILESVDSSQFKLDTRTGLTDTVAEQPDHSVEDPEDDDIDLEGL